MLTLISIRISRPLTIQQAKLALAQDSNDQVALYQEKMPRRRSDDTTKIESMAADHYRLQDEISDRWIAAHAPKTGSAHE